MTGCWWLTHWMVVRFLATKAVGYGHWVMPSPRKGCGKTISDRASPWFADEFLCSFLLVDQLCQKVFCHVFCPIVSDCGIVTWYHWFVLPWLARTHRPHSPYPSPADAHGAVRVSHGYCYRPKWWSCCVWSCAPWSIGGWFPPVTCEIDRYL